MSLLSGSTSRRGGRRSFPTPPLLDCWPKSCRSRPAPTPKPCESMCCAWPSAPRLNLGRSGPVSLMAVRRIGPGCPSRKVGSVSASLAAMYVNWDDRKTDFEVIVGQSVPEDRDARYVGLVHTYGSKPKRRLFDLLTQSLALFLSHFATNTEKP